MSSAYCPGADRAGLFHHGAVLFGKGSGRLRSRGKACPFRPYSELFLYGDGYHRHIHAYYEDDERYQPGAVRSQYGAASVPALAVHCIRRHDYGVYRRRKGCSGVRGSDSASVSCYIRHHADHHASLPEGTGKTGSGASDYPGKSDRSQSHPRVQSGGRGAGTVLYGQSAADRRPEVCRTDLGTDESGYLCDCERRDYRADLYRGGAGKYRRPDPGRGCGPPELYVPDSCGACKAGKSDHYRDKGSGLRQPD